MGEKYKVAILTGVGQAEITEKELRQPQGHQVLVKVDSCAICTLEQRMYNGVMKRYPFAGGHEASGTVVAVGEFVKSLRKGDKVAARLLTSCGECYFCRSGHENQCVISFMANVHEGVGGPGGFAEYMMLDAKKLYKVADDLDLTHAALAEPLACCVHSINNANIGLGEDVVVIGVGIMGAFHIKLAKLRGARVIACEVEEERLEVAKKMGADLLINSKKVNAVDKVKELTEERGADVVFCTAALTKLAEESIQIVSKAGRVIMYSSFHPDNPIDLSVNKVHSSEMNITGAVNANTRDFLAATRLLSSHMVDPSILISETVPLEKLDYAFKRAIDPKTYRIVIKA
ncbi:zinc-dependent alcohol dehydrogenase [Lutispora saccharofermentans]|uniref:Alcohol dehydrogenase catalytic domain-containing protein n=1 Tax=Lutispora saccharofermentans TaxID=3024236 RepID=A0ABT1NJ95_9FIRM|nr:alcohol dehydrogenase catalytic domain-containing protein [Lutispora saccharofermentans]MCQ1531345.1 alcohol dehydrogenase catalytic domain-containing protein [Lutispora saccharofermentans]